MDQRCLTVILDDGGEAASVAGLAESLVGEPGLAVAVVTRLCDLPEGHGAVQFLRCVDGDVVVISSLHPRATFWLLHQFGLRGQVGGTDWSPDKGGGGQQRGDDQPRDRRIWCLDLRRFDSPADCLAEIKRIAAERAAAAGRPAATGVSDRPPAAGPPGRVRKFGGAAPPRWFPVIDYDRCDDCLECLEFCLFGVFEPDAAGRVQVVEPDQCRAGCPACSRVCPQQAIIFPKHKEPGIAGELTGQPGGLKLDLSELFGGTEAAQIAARERLAALAKDADTAVPADQEPPSAQSDADSPPKDHLDKLIDWVNEMEL